MTRATRSAGPRNRYAATALLVLAALISLASLVALAAVDAADSAPSGVDLAAILMRPNMAVAMLLLAGSFGLPDGPRGRAAAFGLTAVGTAIGVLTLIEYAFPLDVGIDRLLPWYAAHATSGLLPGRLSPVSATGIVLLGVASVLRRSRAPRSLAAAQAIAIAMILLANLTSVSFLLGGSLRTGIVPFLSVPILTGAVWLAVALAIVLAEPANGPVAVLWGSDVAARVTRRLIWIGLIGLLLLGWLRLSAERAGLIDTTFGMAFYAAATIAALVVMAIWLGAMIRRSEREASAARADRDRFFDVSADMLALVDRDGRQRTDPLRRLPAREIQRGAR